MNFIIDYLLQNKNLTTSRIRLVQRRGGEGIYFNGGEGKEMELYQLNICLVHKREGRGGERF